MTTTNEPIDDDIHPLDRHMFREPMSKALVRVVVHGHTESSEMAENIASGLLQLLENRAGSKVIVSGDRREALRQGLEGADEPLILFTNSAQEWSKGHLVPLLDAIDKSDHALGRRRNIGKGFRGWIRRIPWRAIFALPVYDIHSCCRIHRVEALRKIPLQSSSAFLDVEILAKATFLGHLIAEEHVPELTSTETLPARWSEIMKVLRHPTFVFDQPTPPELLPASNESPILDHEISEFLDIALVPPAMDLEDPQSESLQRYSVNDGDSWLGADDVSQKPDTAGPGSGS